jgi:competence protein ComEC
LLCVVREASLGVLQNHRLTDAFSLLPGLLLGQRWMVEASVKEALDGAGLSHLMAISGLHVGFVAVILFPLLRALRLGRMGSAVGTAVGLVGYAFLTGARPSVIRATIMACVLIVAGVNQRSWRPMNSLGVAAMAILILEPRSLWDTGFQLSFLATGTILALSRPVLARLPPARVWRIAAGALVVSVSAQAGVAPVLARCFHELHLVAPLANLVVIPLVGVGVALGFATLLFAPVGSWLADILAHANLIPLELSVGCARWLGSLPGASVSVTSPRLLACAAYYAGLGLAAIALRTRRSGLWVAAGACAVVSVGMWWWGPGSARGLEVTVLDVGEGDAIFIRGPGGQTLLVDGGLRTRYGDMGRAVVTPYLRARGIPRLGALMLTHAHNDHVGGLASVVEQLGVGRAYGTGHPHTSWSYRYYLQCLRDREIPPEWVKEGDVLPLGEARLLILYPRESDLLDLRENPRLGLNAISIVARLVHGRFSMLLAGDAEESIERALLTRRHRMASQVLKVGHHGAATGSSLDFLRAVSADVAIISAGAANRFGHPHEEALARLRAAGCRIYRTDVHGAVVVTSDGRSYRVKTTRPPRPSWAAGG